MFRTLPPNPSQPSLCSSKTISAKIEDRFCIVSRSQIHNFGNTSLLKYACLRNKQVSWTMKCYAKLLPEKFPIKSLAICSNLNGLILRIEPWEVWRFGICIFTKTDSLSTKIYQWAFFYSFLLLTGLYFKIKGVAQETRAVQLLELLLVSVPC